MAYNLGPVLPHVRDAAEFLGAKFGVKMILGWGQRDNFTYHSLGRALDLMTTSKAQGDAIAAFSRANAKSLGVIEVIWYQQIWTTARASEGWRAMPDRGSTTANHKDHVHLSFTATRGSGGFTKPISHIGFDDLDPPGDWNFPDLPGDWDNSLKSLFGAIGSAKTAAIWLSDSHNWLRIAMFVAGAIAIIIALVSWDTVKDTAIAAGKAASNGTT